MATVTSTPVNTISRDSLTVLIRNNVMNDSLEFASDCDKMDTDSPVRKPANLRPIKKLFHSPIADASPQRATFSSLHERRKVRKRKRRSLIPDEEPNIKLAYLTECDRASRSPEALAPATQRVVLSLFHNCELRMDFCD